MPRIFDENDKEITPTSPSTPLAVPIGRPLAEVVQEYRVVQSTRLVSFQDMVNELASDGWTVHSMHLASYLEPDGHAVYQAIASDEVHVSNPATVIVYIALMQRTVEKTPPATSPAQEGGPRS